MLNKPLSDHLSEIADLLELNNDNVFRIRAFRRAALAVENHPVDIGSLSREERLEIDGIGKGIADIIEEFKAKNGSSEHSKLKKKFPAGVLQMMRLGGIGPKRAALLYRKRGIDSLVKLRDAAEKGKLETIDGFGTKLQASILKNISFAEQSSKRILIHHARFIAQEMLAYLRKHPAVGKLELAGSARRWKETAGDLDFICTSKNAANVIDHFLQYPEASHKLGAGGTKASLVLKSGLQCDFRVVDEHSFGAALLYFTGSKDHNVRLRELAQKKNMTLNEYGLFKVSDKKQTKPVAGRTEEDVYKALGLEWIPPELREDRGEIEAARKKGLPHLITLEDVLGDFHNHTDMSDGSNTLDEMVNAAKKRGWKWFFSADHSPSLNIANGLTVDRLKKKMAAVRKMNAGAKDFRVFTSSEVDILKDGTMDYPPEILAELDCVVASVHTRFNQPEEEMTDRICNAIRNPNVDILGHWSGRLINKRDSYAVNFDRVLETAKQTMTAIEINGQPERQEMSDVYVKRAIQMGVPLALNTDAHSINELENIVLAVHIARRGWAEPQDILNTLAAEDILKWLKN